MITDLMDRFCLEKSVYWEPSGLDNYGMKTYSSPVEVKTRWEVGMQEVKRADGQIEVSTAVVYVLQSMKIGGYIWKGRLEDLTSDQKSNPKTVENVCEILEYNELTSIYTDGVVRKVIVR